MYNKLFPGQELGKITLYDRYARKEDVSTNYNRIPTTTENPKTKINE